MADVEMAANVVNVNTSTVGTNQPFRRENFATWWSTGHAFIALIYAIIGVSVAVGLGAGDWYTVEASSNDLTSNPAVGGPFGGSTFKTAYYGLRFGSYCYGPQTPITVGTNQAPAPFSVACYPYTYRAQLLYAEWQANTQPGTTSQQQSDANDAAVAYRHLIGASGVITALLALAIAIAGYQFLNSAFASFGVGLLNSPFSAHFSLIVLVAIEAIVIILWVTIFPYSHFYSLEGTQLANGFTTYDIYHTIGLGFSIQIAGLIAGIWGLAFFPRDVVFFSHRSPVLAQNAPATVVINQNAV